MGGRVLGGVSSPCSTPSGFDANYFYTTLTHTPTLVHSEGLIYETMVSFMRIQSYE
jgi:hypothetical protein